MPKEVDPKDTTRAAAYALWMKAPNPMVTFFKTFDVTNLIKVSRKRNPLNLCAMPNTLECSINR